jgi:hypothetical protein
VLYRLRRLPRCLQGQGHTIRVDHTPVLSRCEEHIEGAWKGVLIFVEHGRDLARHGEIDMAVQVVPMQGDAVVYYYYLIFILIALTHE